MRVCSSLLRSMERIIRAKSVDGFRTLRGPERPSDLQFLADAAILALFFTVSLSPSRVLSGQYDCNRQPDSQNAGPLL